jgi:hypothetical protein
MKYLLPVIGRHVGMPGSRQGPSTGAVHSINARLRDELLDGEIFYTLWKPVTGSELLFHRHGVA